MTRQPVATTAHSHVLSTRQNETFHAAMDTVHLHVMSSTMIQWTRMAPHLARNIVGHILRGCHFVTTPRYTSAEGVHTTCKQFAILTCKPR